MATKSLAKLKTEMLFNADLTRLVDVMKGIAAAQYMVTEKKRLNFEGHTKALEEVFSLYDFRRANHPLVRPREGKRLIVVITTDSGFLGGLNMKVLNAAHQQETEDCHYAVLGERGANSLKESGKPFTAFPGINTDETRFDLAKKLTAFIFKSVIDDGFGQVILVHPHAVSFTAQKIEVLNVVPCPLFYKGRENQGVLSAEQQAKKVILESPAKGIIEYLAAAWLWKRLAEIFEDSKLAEFGARTMHLEESYMTLTKMNKQLRLDFFKARREKIDQSLRETFSAKLISREA